MNRTFVSILLLLSSYECLSQNTTVSGHLSGIEDERYIYLTAFPLEKGELYRDSAKVKKGMFSLQLSIREGEGSLYYISSVYMLLDGEGTPVPPIQYTHRWQLLYLQQGRAVVNGDGNHLDSASYSGDKYMEEENDYFVKQRANKLWEKFIDGMDDAYARGENISGSRHMQGDSATKAILMASYIRTQIAESWVKAHPGSPYSATVVYRDVSKFFDDRHEEKTKYFDMLTPAAKNNKVGKFLAAWMHQ